MSSIRIESLRKSYGDVTALHGISLDIPSGQVVALLGPSGCGKTTTLKCLGGLETPSAGAIYIGDRLVADGRRSLPPEQRDIGMVFQSYALWPHMTVAANVGYPLEMRRVAKTEIAPRVVDALAQVGLGGLGRRYPHQLSGGEQQRVALARAIVARPKIVLLDEPLSNLDAVVRTRIRGELKTVLRQLGVTSIYVTHDQTEAMAICERVVLMNGGRIVQDGTPEDLYARPASLFVAQFVGGGNLLQGSLAGWDAGTRTATVRAAGLTIQCALPAAPAPDAAVQVVLRRQGLRLGKEPMGDTNCWPMRMRERTYFGSQIEYLVAVGEAELTVQSEDGGWQPGAAGFLSAPSSTVLGFAGEPAAG